MTTAYDPTTTPTDADELVSWIASTLEGDATTQDLLRGAGRVYEARRPVGGERSHAIVRERMPAGGRPQPFNGLGGPKMQVLFYTFPDEPNLEKWHRETQTRAYQLLTGKTPNLQTSRVVQPIRRTRRPGPPRYDDDVQQYFSMSTYHTSLAPKG